MKKFSLILVTLFILLPDVLFCQDDSVIAMGFSGIAGISQKESGFTCYQWNKPRNWGSMKPIDTSRLTITYNYSFPVKDEDTLRTFRDMDILQIGNRANRFYSAYSQRIDSIAFNHLTTIAQKHLDALTPDWVPFRLRRTLYDWIPQGIYPLYQDVYTYPSQEKRVVSSRFQYDEYRYSEKTDPFEWTLLPGEETVLGYVCNKAETTFRGRKWIAWYTFDIPYSSGPWKFSGLPGLILKVTDSEENFTWEAAGIAKSENEPICEFVAGYSTDKRVYVWIPNRKIKECSRKEMERLWKRFWNAPLSIHLLDRLDAIFIDDNRRVKVSLSDPVPDDFYPRLELD